MNHSSPPLIFHTNQIILFFFLWLVFSGCVHAIMPLPEGIDYQSKGYCIGAEDIEFLSDLTYKNAVGETVHEQEIFDTIFTLIDNAREYILIDMFLFNSYTGKGEKAYRRLCSELMSKNGLATLTAAAILNILSVRMSQGLL